MYDVYVCMPVYMIEETWAVSCTRRSEGNLVQSVLSTHLCVGSQGHSGHLAYAAGTFTHSYTRFWGSCEWPWRPSLSWVSHICLMKYDHIQLPFSSPTSPNVAPKIYLPTSLLFLFLSLSSFCFLFSLQHLINAANIHSRTWEICQWPQPQKKKKVSLSPSSTVGEGP